ncbi:MAG: isochorismatase family cysteine hydrolase [Sulfolobales archaeon]|nr:cysteine hydrolase [Sulfolobales archaeon]MDW8083326.1 isochorismatase family cysteine hydrolase [Sulfolobales archaeon]
MSEYAVLVIDMLYDFIYGKIKCQPCAEIIGKVREVVQVARSTGISVVYVNDSHYPTDPEIKVWGEHAMKGEEASKVVDELKPLDRDYVLEKRTYSAFFETGLDLLLRGLGVKTIVVTGIHTHICVKHTVADAFFRGYSIIVLRDATATFNPRDHEEALNYMKTMYGAKIMTLDELFRLWTLKQI